MDLKKKFRREIVLVEDESDFQQLYLARLKVMGFDVRLAQDGLQAIETVQKYSPDLILLDMMLPKVNGFKVCAELKDNRSTKDIPIIAISALHEPVFRRKAIDCGADAYFVKPLDWDVLDGKIKKLLKMNNG